MTRQAEKDIRSALRQLRGSRNRVAMARTSMLHMNGDECDLLECARQQADRDIAEAERLSGRARQAEEMERRAGW